MIKKILLPLLIVTIQFQTFSAETKTDYPKTTSHLVSFKNKVQLKYGDSLWRNASLNQLIKAGTTIRTGVGSKAQIIYGDGTITNIGSRTSLTVLDKNTREYKVTSGNIWYKVTKKSYGLKIYAPNAIATITGTEGGVKVESDNNKDKTKKTGLNVTLVLSEGTISVAMNNKQYKMNAGDRVSYSTLKPTAVDYKNIGSDKVKDLFESSK